MEFTELIESCYGKLIGGKALTTGEKKKIKQASTADKVSTFYDTYIPGLAEKYNFLKSYIEEPSITTLLDHFTHKYGLSYALTDLHAKYHELLKDGNHVQAFKMVKREIDEGFHTFLKEQLENSKHNADKIYNSVKTEIFLHTLFETLCRKPLEGSVLPRDEIIFQSKTLKINDADAKEIANRRDYALSNPLQIEFNNNQTRQMNKLLAAYGHYEKGKELYHLMSISGKYEYYIWLYLMGDTRDMQPISFQFYLQPDTLIIKNTSDSKENRQGLRKLKPFEAIRLSIKTQFNENNKKHLFTFHSFQVYLYDEIYAKYHQKNWASTTEKKSIQTYYLTILHNLHQVTKTFNNVSGYDPKNLDYDSSNDRHPWRYFRTKKDYSKKEVLHI